MLLKSIWRQPKQTFVIVPPRKLAHKKETKGMWPDDQKALYAVFTWELAEEEPEEIPTKVNQDLFPLLFPYADPGGL